MYSIDQNCHSLWDVIPKLHALIRSGRQVTHFVEDIDVAFTDARAGQSSGLRLAREQFHRGGVADWGAALFYSEYLGRLPVDIRQWQELVGMKLSVLARKLSCGVDDLYDEFSASDNWQLIGPSYVGSREYHRVIGDLTVSETADAIRQVFAKAKANCMTSFPQRDSQQRLKDWFNRESELLDRLLAETAGGMLVDLYRLWLKEYLGDDARLAMTSSLFANDPANAPDPLLEIFLADYDLASGLYNEAIAETGLGLRQLDTDAGELPFFAILRHAGHLVRCSTALDGSSIRLGSVSIPLLSHRRLPMDKLAGAGVICLAGKAVLLTLQVRSGPHGNALALPYRGSGYMPASHSLADKLSSAGLLPQTLAALVRVRLGMLEHLKQTQTIIRLPEHLKWYFGQEELPAAELGHNYADLAKEAAARLESFKDQAARRKWLAASFSEATGEIGSLNAQRRQLAQSDPKAPVIRQLGRRQKELELALLRSLLEQIARDTQLSQIDYWDSRGAVLPWCVALGGEQMYDRVLDQAEIYSENGSERD